MHYPCWLRKSKAMLATDNNEHGQNDLSKKMVLVVCGPPPLGHPPHTLKALTAWLHG